MARQWIKALVSEVQAPQVASPTSNQEQVNIIAGELNDILKRLNQLTGGNNPNAAGSQFFVVGYKGTSAFDAGLFYCPYVPLQMVRAVDPNTFQPKIGFKTRYGMVANPFAEGGDVGEGRLAEDSNVYYRRVIVNNLM